VVVGVVERQGDILEGDDGFDIFPSVHGGLLELNRNADVGWETHRFPTFVSVVMWSSSLKRERRYHEG
jgi:hypothetical protein